MSYSVCKNERGQFDIFEKQSETIIQLSRPTEDETRDICRKLNLGSGFNGWTPEFLAKKFDVAH
jgi:hypothetical protein